MNSFDAILIKWFRLVINGGLRSAIRKLIPVRTGALRDSLTFRIFNRHGRLIVTIELLDYSNYVSPVGEPDHRLWFRIEQVAHRGLQYAVIRAFDEYISILFGDIFS